MFNLENFPRHVTFRVSQKKKKKIHIINVIGGLYTQEARSMEKGEKSPESKQPAQIV